MQIAIFVGHRPRPPSSSAVSLFPPRFLFPSIFFSRGSVAAGTQVTRNEKQPSPMVRRLPLALLSALWVANGLWNSIGATLSRRWMARACSDGL